MSLILAVLMLAWTPQSGFQPGAIPAEARAAIAAANREYFPALKARDAAKISAPYADDGIYVNPTNLVLKGRDAIAKSYTQQFRVMGKILGGELVQDGVIRQGSLIYEWGHVSIKPAGAEQRDGRYLTVWRRGDTGRWEIMRKLWLPD